MFFVADWRSRVAGGMENRPKIKYSQSTIGFRNRLGQLENVPKLVSEWSGDSRKVEKIWIENRYAVTLFQGAGTVESENIEFGRQKRFLRNAFEHDRDRHPTRSLNSSTRGY